jgi:hypothetical protein
VATIEPRIRRVFFPAVRILPIKIWERRKKKAVATVACPEGKLQPSDA